MQTEKIKIFYYWKVKYVRNINAFEHNKYKDKKNVFQIKNAYSNKIRSKWDFL